MSRAKEIFQAVCNAPDLCAAVAELPLKEWRKLHSFLLQRYDENGVTGQVLGVVLVDAANRLAKIES